MHTLFIILHIVAAVAAVFLVVGIVSILKGLVFKIEKTIKHGTIITAIAVFFLASMHFACMMHCNKTCQENCCDTEMKCPGACFDKCTMFCNPSFYTDSADNDSSKTYMHHKMIIKDRMACDPSKCDTSKCKKTCPHHAE